MEQEPIISGAWMLTCDKNPFADRARLPGKAKENNHNDIRRVQAHNRVLAFLMSWPQARDGFTKTGLCTAAGCGYGAVDSAVDELIVAGIVVGEFVPSRRTTIYRRLKDGNT